MDRRYRLVQRMRIDVDIGCANNDAVARPNKQGGVALAICRPIDCISWFHRIQCVSEQHGIHCHQCVDRLCCGVRAIHVLPKSSLDKALKRERPGHSSGHEGSRRCSVCGTQAVRTSEFSWSILIDGELFDGLADTIPAGSG